MLVCVPQIAAGLGFDMASLINNPAFISMVRAPKICRAHREPGTMELLCSSVSFQFVHRCLTLMFLVLAGLEQILSLISAMSDSWPFNRPNLSVKENPDGLNNVNQK